jgi:hypothetical protein
VTLLLDSGALVALERNDRATWRRLKGSLLRHDVPVTHGGIIGQVWRGAGPRQAMLARALEGIDVRPLTDGLGRATGELLARSRTKDVIDAALVLLASDGDEILTSDGDDIVPLARLVGRHIEIIDV